MCVCLCLCVFLQRFGCYSNLTLAPTLVLIWLCLSWWLLVIRMEEFAALRIKRAAFKHMRLYYNKQQHIQRWCLVMGPNMQLATHTHSTCTQLSLLHFFLLSFLHPLHVSLSFPRLHVFGTQAWSACRCQCGRIAFSCEHCARGGRGHWRGRLSLLVGTTCSSGAGRSCSAPGCAICCTSIHYLQSK